MSLPLCPVGEAGGLVVKLRFALVMTFVLIGFLAVPALSQTAAASGPAPTQTWKQELFGAPTLDDASGQGGQSSGALVSGPVVGPNVRVNAQQQPFPAGFLGRSETTIAVAPDGLHMVAGFNDAQGFCGAPFGAACTPQVPSGLSGYAFSADGGSTWTDGGAPDPALGFASVGVPVFTRGDPWLAVGGDTWLGPAIAGPERPDSVANCGNAGTLQQSSVPVFGLDGDVFVTWQVGPTFSAAGVPSKNAAIFVAHSLDGGATFGAPVKVADINSMRQDAPVGYNRGRINDHPRIAVLSQGEAEGRVLVVFPSAKVPTSAPSTAQNLVSVNVFLSFSDDGGATWI